MFAITAHIRFEYQHAYFNIIFRDARMLLQALVGAIVIFNAVTALNPGGTTFSEANQKDIQKRPAGMTQQIRY